MSSASSLPYSKPVPSESVSESFRADVKRINANIRPRDAYTDSEDEGEILYKDEPDEPTSDEDVEQQSHLALKLARRDTIARQKEINEIKNNARNNENIEFKNDVSLIVFTLTYGQPFRSIYLNKLAKQIRVGNT